MNFKNIFFPTKLNMYIKDTFSHPFQTKNATGNLEDNKKKEKTNTKEDKHSIIGQADKKFKSP